MAGLVDGLARLRIEVFREYPYLYDGSLDYEKRYLERLSASDRGLLVAAEDGENLVGASTAMPLADAEEAFQNAFLSQGLKLESYFYLAESVLLPDYRGRGCGRRFFEEREAFARQFEQFQHLCFCAVDRPENHPARPARYRPLDNFWRSLGFERRPELTTLYPWQDVGDQEETEKPMTFWLKAL